MTPKLKRDPQVTMTGVHASQIYDIVDQLLARNGLEEPLGDHEPVAKKDLTWAIVDPEGAIIYLDGDREKVFCDIADELIAQFGLETPESLDHCSRCGKSRASEYAGGKYWVQCPCGMRTVDCVSQAEARAIWNRRAV